MRYVGPRHFHIDTPPFVPVPWSPDNSFQGQTVVIVGGGPSHAALDLNVLKGIRFIVVNSACRKVRPVATADDFLIFTDNAWAENRPELVTTWPGPVVTANSRAKARLGDKVRYLDVTALTQAMGVMSDHAQASSGHIAACLAVVMGAVKLVLVGFECRAINGRTHGHDDYKQHDLAAFDERFIPGWRRLAEVFAERKVEVVNASPGSALDMFSFGTL